MSERLTGVSVAVQDLISIFNDNELELMVCGLPEIDTDDLRANTEYTGYTASSPVVQYFWEVIRRPTHALPLTRPSPQQSSSCGASVSGRGQASTCMHTLMPSSRS